MILACNFLFYDDFDCFGIWVMLSSSGYCRSSSGKGFEWHSGVAFYLDYTVTELCVGLVSFFYLEFPQLGKNAQYEKQLKFPIDVHSKKNMSNEQNFRTTENNQ